MEQKGPNFIVLHAPAVLAKPWAAVRGEFGVYRAGPDKADGLQLVDYVAWSAPGSVRGEKKRRAGPWPASRFAPLAEGFGAYDPSTRLMPGSSIGLFPGNTDGVPDHLAVYDNDEATPGKPNGGPRPKARILCAGRRAQTASARAWERGTMAGVSLKNVAKSYDAVQVIRDLSLEIRNREFMVLVGPSGCGKSTALRMIAGLEEISGGTITIGDRVVNDLPPKDRDIAMVFQSYALYPHMTVRQNLEFGLKIRKMPHAEIDRLVNSTAQMLGIEHLLDRKPRELSGGQRQRVAVGRAIVRQPAVFLFDEPLSNLDAKLRVQMRAEIAKLQQRLQTTTIYVTHDQVEAMTMGQRVAVMKDGDLKQVGTPMELYDKPANVFVASFIGMPPMNLISATIRDSGAYLATARSALPVPGSLRAVTAGKDGTKVTVGIRPENIRGIGSQVAGETVTVASDVEIIEPLGNEVVVHGRVGDDLLVAKLDPHAAPRLGDVIELVFELEKLHLFDAGTEQRLDA